MQIRRYLTTSPARACGLLLAFVPLFTHCGAHHTQRSLASVAGVSAAHCPDGFEGDLRVDSPAAPDLVRFESSRCAVIDGDLDLSGYAGTALPDALQRLRKVRGDILVVHTQLKSLAMPHLRTMDGELVVLSNADLESITDFSQLSHIGGSLRIGFYRKGNPLLEEIAPFTALTRVGGEIRIYNNDALTDLKAFPALQIAKGGIAIMGNDGLQTIGDFPALIRAGSIHIRDNDVLASIGTFPKLTAIDGRLVLTTNGRLTTLDGFGALQRTGDMLNISKNPMLARITGFGHLRAVGGELSVAGNNALTNIEGLLPLPAISSRLYARNNPLLSSCLLTRAIGHIRSVPGAMRIGNNGPGCDARAKSTRASAPNCTVEQTSSGMLDVRCAEQQRILAAGCPDGFPGNVHIRGPHDPVLAMLQATDCTAIRGDLDLTGYRGSTLPPVLHALTYVAGDFRVLNTQLSALSLPNLGAVGGQLVIGWNAHLKALGPFSDLTVIGDGLWIQNNPALTDLSTFKHLIHVYGYVWIRHNDALTNLGGFNLLTLVEGALRITHNERLSNIGGGDTLRLVGGDLIVRGNPALAVIEAFGNLTRIGGSWIVGDNPHLTAIGKRPHLSWIGGSVQIYNNAAMRRLGVFTQLALIDGDLTVCYNSALSAIRGLGTLARVDGTVWFAGNDALIDGQQQALITRLRTLSDHVQVLHSNGPCPAP